jgi:hypothetical protein
MKRLTDKRTLGTQLLEMKRLHPEFRCELRRNALVCVGGLRPRPICDEYLVEVRYDLNKRPKVTVLKPLLTARPGERIPHRFSDGSLCLHMPREWRSSMSIAEYILPWAALWLYFYEIWYITGKWLGGGHEPTGRKHRAR